MGVLLLTWALESGTYQAGRSGEEGRKGKGSGCWLLGPNVRAPTSAALVIAFLWERKSDLPPPVMAVSRSLRRTNPITYILAAGLCIFFLYFFFADGTNIPRIKTLDAGAKQILSSKDAASNALSPSTTSSRPRASRAWPRGSAGRLTGCRIILCIITTSKHRKGRAGGAREK